MTSKQKFLNRIYGIFVVLACSLVLIIGKWIFSSQENQEVDETRELDVSQTESEEDKLITSTPTLEEFVTAISTPSLDSFVEPVTLIKHSSSNLPPSKASHVLREEMRSLSPELVELGKRFESDPFNEMEVPLFGNETFILKSVSHHRLSDESGIFSGEIVGEPGGGHLVLSYVRRSVAGSIHLPSRMEFYEIRAADSGKQSILSQIDPEKIPPCGVCVSGNAGPFSR